MSDLKRLALNALRTIFERGLLYAAINEHYMGTKVKFSRWTKRFAKTVVRVLDAVMGEENVNGEDGISNYFLFECKSGGRAIDEKGVEWPIRTFEELEAYVMRMRAPPIETKGSAAADLRMVYRVPEAGRLLGLTKNASYLAAKRGDIPTIRFGGALRVPKVAFHAKFKI